MKLSVLTCSLVLAALLVAPTVHASTFVFSYSGAFGSAAVATGLITIDESLLLNPGVNIHSDTAFVRDLTLTISGARAGNGTFTLSDFGDILLKTNGGRLDLTRELIGQPTSGNPFGTTHDGSSGDFNLFNFDFKSRNIINPNAPNGTGFFYFNTNGGRGDALSLTSFRPAAPSNVPEPGSVALLVGIGISGAGIMLKRRKPKTA